MRLRSLALFLAGVAATAAWFVACGGGSPGQADAATCDCPAAEPPIAGRVVQVVGTPIDAPPGGGNFVSASCAQGAILLSGGCSDGGGNPDPAVVLQVAGPNPDSTAWECAYANNRPTGSVSITATALCLMPAQ